MKRQRWTDNSVKVEDFAERVPVFGLPIYDNITGPPEPPEGWEPTEIACVRCHRRAPYVPEQKDAQGFYYCTECWDMLPVMD